MFTSGYQGSLIALLAPASDEPLQLWRVVGGSQTGVAALVQEEGAGVSLPVVVLPRHARDAYIECPRDAGTSLGVRLGYLHLLVRISDDRPRFAFEIEVSDSDGRLRRFRLATTQATVEQHQDLCSLPLVISGGQWSNIMLDLGTLTNRVYGTQFASLERIRIYGACSLGRVYLTDRTLQSTDLPPEFRLYRATGG